VNAAYTSQISYHFVTDNIDGYHQQIHSYLDYQLKNWDVYNYTTFKYSEEKNELGTYFLRNYAKNRLKMNKIFQHFQFSTYLDFGFYPKKNIANQISGFSDFYEKKLEIGSGYQIKYYNQFFYLENEVNYFYHSFQNIQVVEDESDNIDDSDLLIRTKVSTVELSPFNYFIENRNFYDLNESLLFNFQQTEGGIDFSHQFNRIHILKQIFSIGYHDVYPSIPYYLHTKTRFTSKFAHQYMIIQKYEMQFWMNKKAQQLYYGNGFAEILLQRSFAFSPQNDISQIQVGAKYYPAEERSILKANFRYFYKRFTTFGQYKYYYHFANLEHSFETGIRLSLLEKRLIISYQFMQKMLKNMENETLNQISIEMEF
jgi:hypothetical protein